MLENIKYESITFALPLANKKLNKFCHIPILFGNLWDNDCNKNLFGGIILWKDVIILYLYLVLLSMLNLVKK